MPVFFPVYEKRPCTYTKSDGTVVEYMGDVATGEKRAEHVGCVLKTGHHGWHDDWDELVIVWNPVEKKPESIIVYSTRFGVGDISFKIDATDEVLAEYHAYLRNI